MPLYDYQCKECAEMFEVEHGMDYNGPKPQCPTCRTYMTHRIILQAPSIYVYWKDARSTDEASLPKYFKSTSNKARAEDFGGV